MESKARLVVARAREVHARLVERDVELKGSSKERIEHQECTVLGSENRHHALRLKILPVNFDISLAFDWNHLAVIYTNSEQVVNQQTV